MDLVQVFSNSGDLAGNNRRLHFCPQCGQRLHQKTLAKFERQRCDRCAFVHYLNPHPGITIIIRSREGKVLIGRRSERSRYGGRWCLPGGYIEYEESFIDTAHREVAEETGLKIRIDGIVNVVSNHLDDLHHTLVVVLTGQQSGGILRPGDDLTALRWIDGEQHKEIGYAFEADRSIVDCYFAGNIKILPIDPGAEQRLA
ncbi:NUDIX hydrolase [Desulfobulbus propionicus DSM 2032]|jgi:ADP-ribose pyrophosphatase YjhB (NUDIX family)|uniref:NUDIX hydrolase n=1 Tax=Desulfobulbus propionicus (strain ATCC 33891 / DSM 2032 / VKM B-1956 / 1pr3) TaxID=577650 RepID=A0A7U3YPG2_DESPD|nr:NUDIX hydrolase [Desulfobulbus propionicus]ADW19139.1 NUDIX hydrolase [Desulfobulbus propionicus DSM 2032]